MAYNCLHSVKFLRWFSIYIFFILCFSLSKFLSCGIRRECLGEGLYRGMLLVFMVLRYNLVKVKFINGARNGRLNHLLRVTVIFLNHFLITVQFFVVSFQKIWLFKRNVNSFHF